ncbi:MAG: CRISPR-associated endonuclease Cas1 [Paludibacteraceae bacterium]|nr:CRISPR-associated endonuclease Cas1 [Paludibacteraceae bacterium]
MELVLNTFGVTLSRDNEGFVIVTAEGKQRIPAEGITSIQMSRGAQISSDAVLLAMEKEIEVLFVDKAGAVIGRIWSPKYGSISTIRKGQLAFSFSKDALEWIKEVLRQKIENQQALLLMFRSDNEAQNESVAKSIAKMEDHREKLGKLDGDIVADVAAQLRGWEGQASKIYFDTLNIFLPEHLRFQNRSQHPALDVVNALLNYGYGLLYGKIEGSLIKAGVDPYIGILHRDDYNRPVLVYDVIELYRVWVDYVVFSLVSQNSITDDYYSVKEDGSYWLEPLGRRVLIQSLNDYLEEVTNVRGISRSRNQQIFLYCQNLAQKFKKFDE